jgi:hypothetical protein
VVGSSLEAKQTPLGDDADRSRRSFGNIIERTRAVPSTMLCDTQNHQG